MVGDLNSTYSEGVGVFVAIEIVEWLRRKAGVSDYYD